MGRVFLGDSITQGWGDDFHGKFGGVKLPTAASRATRRGACSCGWRTTCWRFDPSGVVMLMGTNDIDDGATPAKWRRKREVDSRRAQKARPEDADRAMRRVSQLVDEESADGKNPRAQSPRGGGGEGRSAGDDSRHLDAVCQCEGRREARGVSGSVASERRGYREVGGGAAADLRDARLVGNRGRRFHARSRVTRCCSTATI